jgi:hypothetical protein
VKLKDLVRYNLLQGMENANKTRVRIGWFANGGLKTTLGEGRSDTFNAGGPRGPSAGPETSFVVLPQQHPRWAQTRIVHTS